MSWAVALALEFFAGAGNSQAADFVWTSGNGYWQSSTVWTTNGAVGPVGFPGGTNNYHDPKDGAWFTNAATYSVTLTNDVSVGSNFFGNASNTLATVTLNLGTNALFVATDDPHPGAFTVGDQATSTTIVYLASSTVGTNNTLASKGLIVPNRVVVGRNGIGTLILTNGYVWVGNRTILGNGDFGHGTLVLSGSNTLWNNTEVSIGNNSNTSGNVLVISNGATMITYSTFRLGSGAIQGGNSGNLLLLDSGGRLFTGSGPTTIGHRSYGAAPSYNNTAIVRGGASWNNDNRSFCIGSQDGGAATGNVLTVGSGGFVTNFSHLYITASNTLDMAGGVLGGSVVHALAGTVTNRGIFQGFGTCIGNLIVTNGGFFSPFNSLGTLVFSNSLRITSNSTTTVQLGTNFHATVVASNLMLDGTLNVNDGGGLTANTYTLFTYGRTLTYHNVAIGSAPAGYTYAINTNTAGEVRLAVGYSTPVAGFSGSPTNGEAPLTVTFTDTSTGIITNRFWDFGDGNTSNAIVTSLSHSYSFAGTRTVSLTVSGPGGTNTSTQPNYIVATNPAPPVAGFNVSTHGGLAPLAVTFTDTSTGNVTNRFWDFGDGNTSNTTATSVGHSYTRGIYTISLIVRGLGGSSTRIETNWITALEPAHLVVNPGSLNYGSVTIGQTNYLSFSLVNTGDIGMGGWLTVAAPFAVTGSPPYVVNPGQTQTLAVAFAPSSAGTFTGIVIFGSSGGNPTNAVRGVGLTAGSISVTPTTRDFGLVATGTTARTSFIVTNSGGTAVSNGTATVSGSPFTIVSGATFSAPGFGSTNVTVQFAPVSVGAFTDTVVFATANGGAATNTVLGASHSPAISYTWTNGNDYWQSTTAWSPAGGFPSAGENAFFAKAGTYTVTLSNGVVNIGSNFFQNPGHTTARITLDLGTNSLSVIGAGTTPGAFVVGQNGTEAEAYLYLASSAIAGKGLFVTNSAYSARLVIGRNGFGAMFVTNGNVTADTLVFGSGSGGRGVLVLSGSETIFTNTSSVSIGNHSGSSASSLVISNAGTMAVLSSFRVGSGSSSGGSSNNTLVLDSGGRLFTHSGPVTIGHRSTGSAPSYNNRATVQAGALWDNQNHSFAIGVAPDSSGVATGNVLAVLTGGVVTNISTFTITASNALNMAGGLIQAERIFSSGTVEGFGTIMADLTITNGGSFNPANALGELVLSENLSILSNSTTTVQLGTNFHATAVASNLTLDGALNVSNGGGFTNGTYALFTYGGGLNTNGTSTILTIGTTPDSSMTYVVDITTSGQVNVVVWAPPAAGFSASPTNGLAPLAVTFTDTSSGTITNRFWNFGDGGTSNTLATSVVHTYNTAGTNTVQLTVSGPVGLSTSTRVDYILVAPPCSFALSATNASFGVTGGSNIVTVSTYTNVCAWAAISNDAWIQIVGGSISSTGSAVVAYTVLSNAISRNSRTGTMTIAGQTFTVTQAGDAMSPTVALTAPASGNVSNTIAVSATATDDVAVVQVEFYRDGGVLIGADATPPYGVNFDTAGVSDGPHCFYAEAYDAANNAGGSSTNCVTVDNDAPSVPTGLAATAVATNQINLSWVASSDSGSGVAGYRVFRDGTQIATTANTNYSDTGLAMGSTYCYRVVAYDSVGHVSGQTADACAQTFVTPGSLFGTYNGLAIQTNAPSHASSGSIQIRNGTTGAFTANLTMGGVKSMFKGQFNAGGNATNTVLRKGLSPMQVILHLDLSYGTDQVTGTVSDGVFTSVLAADRMVYGTSTPCPLAGSYTMVLSPPGSNASIPQGYGYATLVVATTGSGKLSGVLGDGTKWKGTVPVSKRGTGPLYSLLYRKLGSCLGWVTFVSSNNTLEATVDWFRPAMPTSVYYPAGFTTNVTLIGEKYVSPSAGGPGPSGDREITLGGGNLVSGIVKTVTVDAVGNVVVPAPNSESLELKLQPTTGQFSGSFTHPTLNKAVKFNALTLQSDNSGAGYFLGTNESGYVVVEPLP